MQLTPSTKEYICIICGESIPKTEYRLRLFRKDKKTSHCLLLEKHLKVSVSQSVCTDHVCRACVRKLTNLENKVSQLKEKCDATSERLQVSHGKTTQKRMLTDQGPRSKKTLFSSEPTVLQPHTDTQTVSKFYYSSFNTPLNHKTAL